ADTGVEAAHLVDQLAFQRLAPGPRLALRDRTHLIGRQLAGASDDIDKRAVDALDILAHEAALLVGERPLVAVQSDAVAEGDRLPVEKQLLPHRAGDDLASQDSDRAGQCARPGDDPRARGRDVVPT